MNNLERKEFEERRRNIIGGSDAGAIMQIGKVRNIMDVYLSKIDPEFKSKELPVFELGQYLEPYVLMKYEELVGNKVINRQLFSTHPYHDFIGCHIDGKSLDGKVIVEAKTTAFKTEEWGTEGTDIVPDDIYFQCQHNMMVCNIERVDVPVLYRGTGIIELFVIFYDEKVCNSLLKKEIKFWNENIIPRIPPSIISKNNIINGTNIEADDEIYSNFVEYNFMKSQVKNLCNNIEIFKKDILSYMGENESLTKNGKTLATNKLIKGSRFNLERFRNDYPELNRDYTIENSYTQFRIK